MRDASWYQSLVDATPLLSESQLGVVQHIGVESGLLEVTERVWPRWHMYICAVGLVFGAGSARLAETSQIANMAIRETAH